MSFEDEDCATIDFDSCWKVTKQTESFSCQTEPIELEDLEIQTQTLEDQQVHRFYHLSLSV